MRTASRLAPVLLAWLLAGAAPAAAAPAPARGLRAEVAALLMQGVAGGSLPIAVTVFPEPAAESGAAGLAFLVELPPAPQPGDGEERPVEIYAYAVDGAGEVAGYFADELSNWPAGGEGVKLAGRLDTPAGELSLRVLAWDPVGRRYGLAVRRTGGAAPPRAAEACPGWTAAGPGAERLAAFSARPVLVRGETQRLSPGRPPPPEGWRVRLSGGAWDAPPAETAVAGSLAASGELVFVVPDVPAGVYGLTVEAADGSWRSPPLETWLVEALPPVEAGCARSWSGILRLARAGALGVGPGPGAAPAAAPPADSRAGRLRAGYERVLRRLASSSDLAAAARELADLEASEAAGGASRARLPSAVMLERAKGLAARDPRCLLPLIALHGEAYRVHHKAGRFPLATFSRRLAAAIAELAAQAAAEPEERRLVAVALTGLAEMVETRRASIEAQRLLERALALDGERQAARLLLAVSYERKGLYEGARRQLEALVAANSAHFEARLRLAILLRRIGEPLQAKRLLRALVAERPPAWLLALAYQTLAQVLVREARLGEAVAVLEDARARLPADQPLQLLLAYTQDRAGERRAAQQTLAGLPLAEAAVTPRFRYSDEPAAALGLLRETLRQSVFVRLPLLALALAGDAAPQGGAARKSERPGGPAS